MKRFKEIIDHIHWKLLVNCLHSRLQQIDKNDNDDDDDDDLYDNDDDDRNGDDDKNDHCKNDDEEGEYENQNACLR